jgi:hypothetical protein
MYATHFFVKSEFTMRSCRYYRADERGVYEVEKEFSGKGYCPYNPRHNSTSIFTGKRSLPIFKEIWIFP